MKKYPWEIAVHLAEEIKVRNTEAATESICTLIDCIYEESNKRSFAEVKLRVLQILTIANRAAHDAEANPNSLFNVSIEVVNRIIKLRTKEQLISVAQNDIKRVIELVPEKDCIKTKKVDEAIQYIRANCSMDISRDEVASEVGCSPSYLSRIFSDVTGRTFKEFVLKYRMEEAKKLLLNNSKETISEIAFKMGYNNPNYFSETFKRITGTSPSEYRKYNS